MDIKRGLFVVNFPVRRLQIIVVAKDSESPIGDSVSKMVQGKNGIVRFLNLDVFFNLLI